MYISFSFLYKIRVKPRFISLFRRFSPLCVALARDVVQTLVRAYRPSQYPCPGAYPPERFSIHAARPGETDQPQLQRGQAVAEQQRAVLSHAANSSSRRRERRERERESTDCRAGGPSMRAPRAGISSSVNCSLAPR